VFDMRYAAVSFDVDGTLLDLDAAIRRGLEEVVAWVGERHPGGDGLTVDRLRELRDAVAAESVGMAQAAIRRESFRRALDELGIGDAELVDGLTARYLDRRYASIELYPDAVRALPALRGRLRIGIVSNGNSFADRCGIATPFDFEVYSERAGCAKPDAAIFRLACAAAGCRAEELVHVGDSLSEDVLAARTAGCAAVWLRRGRGAGEAPAGVPVIGSLDELPKLLE
jgi:FMN hydrolase / 5-amino-6-(5-phospho-D-ribitylamino)uracil phosphatase